MFHDGSFFGQWLMMTYWMLIHEVLRVVGFFTSLLTGINPLIGHDRSAFSSCVSLLIFGGVVIHSSPPVTHLTSKLPKLKTMMKNTDP